jgi:hypothetical protein
MTKDDGAVDGPGRRRDPATRNPRLEELVGGRAMVPHGDRIDGAESGRVEDVEAVCFLDDDVVREFVLHDDLDDIGTLCAAPREHIFERA